MNSSLQGVSGSASPSTAKEGEIVGRLRRAESCAETLLIAMERLEKSLAPVVRPSTPSIDSAHELKSVGYCTPLAQQIDSLSDRLQQCVDMVYSVQGRIEI